jgi:hypothetical protein
VKITIGTIGLRLLRNIFGGTFERATETATKTNISAREIKFLHIKIITINSAVSMIFILASSLCTRELPL